jgi:hypothetical protein
VKYTSIWQEIAFITYKDLPACFDELQPIDQMKEQKEMPGHVEPSSSIASEEIGLTKLNIGKKCLG